MNKIEGKKMKTIIALFLMLGCFRVYAAPNQVGLAWDPSPDSTVTGYKIYAMSEPDTTYKLAATVGKVTTVTVPTRPFQNKKFVAAVPDETTFHVFKLLEPSISYFIPVKTSALIRIVVTPPASVLEIEMGPAGVE